MIATTKSTLATTSDLSEGDHYDNVRNYVLYMYVRTCIRQYLEWAPHERWSYMYDILRII